MRLTPPEVAYFLPKLKPTVIGRKLSEMPLVLTLVKRLATTRRVLPVPILKATAAPPPKPTFVSDPDTVPAVALTLYRPTPAFSITRAGALAGWSAYTKDAMPPMIFVLPETLKSCLVCEYAASALTPILPVPGSQYVAPAAPTQPSLSPSLYVPIGMRMPALTPYRRCPCAIAGRAATTQSATASSTSPRRFIPIPPEGKRGFRGFAYSETGTTVGNWP